MTLEQLSISNFKNCALARLQFDAKINCLFGNNGAGKTNLLDAIHYLSFTRSYFTSIDQQHIRFGEGFFNISGQFLMPSGVKENVSIIQPMGERKKVIRNDKECERFSDHIGQFPLVMISPSDSDLINEGSDLRRRFFDMMISQFSREYLDQLMRYNKALMQRNKLLKQMGESGRFDRDSLMVWDHILIPSGDFISQERQVFLNSFIPEFHKIHRLLTGKDEIASIEFENGVKAEDMQGSIDQHLSRDRMARYSTAGIHKDDFLFTLDNNPIKRFGSQGQQKSFLIALKLAQYQLTVSRKNTAPILLFDDIFDKLDAARVDLLISMVSAKPFGQVFITDTHKVRLNEILPHHTSDFKLFQVENGNIQLD